MLSCTPGLRFVIQNSRSPEVIEVLLPDIREGSVFGLICAFDAPRSSVDFELWTQTKTCDAEAGALGKPGHVLVWFHSAG